MKGMGVGSRALITADDYTGAYQPGHFWTTLLEGPHVSSDVALVDGVPHWWRHATGVASGAGTFDHWEVHAEPDPRSRNGAARGAGSISKATPVCSTSRRSAVASSKCICASPTSGQTSTATAGWRRPSGSTPPGMAVRRFTTAHRLQRRAVRPPWLDITSQPLQRAIVEMPGISSLQITFHEELPPGRHAMPPGGFRVAIVNCWDRAAGNAARDSCGPLRGGEERPFRSCAAGTRRTG